MGGETRNANNTDVYVVILQRFKVEEILKCLCGNSTFNKEVYSTLIKS